MRKWSGSMNTCVADTDLALLRLEREIDAVPMKIADRKTQKK